MPRVVAYFFAGALLGFSGLFALGQGIIHLLFPGLIQAAIQRSGSAAEYDTWYLRHVTFTAFALGTVGALLCGTLCGMWSVHRHATPRFRVVKRRSNGDDTPLTSDQFDRVLKSCLFVPLAEREPSFVQGAIVGRLIESDPDLAVKVDHFSQRHMEALWRDLCHGSGFR